MEALMITGTDANVGKLAITLAGIIVLVISSTLSGIKPQTPISEERKAGIFRRLKAFEIP
jgi:hypothetical protein